MQKTLQGKIALVTGVGRRAGIGAAICREIAKNGGDVFFTYWHPYDRTTHPENAEDELKNFATELKELGVRVGSIELDLATSDSAEQLFQAVENILCLPDVLINNACHDYEVPFVDLTPTILDQHYAVNVRAVTMLCKEFVKNGKPGAILNMTSGQSRGSMGGRKIPYTITKAALEMLAKQLAPELQKRNITINAVDPGPTDTGWMTGEIKEKIREDSPSGTINTPEDIGKFLVSLLLDGSKTGEVVRVERSGD
jgi:3-oxoacyl-[acyl-carrier protein] reductase